VKIDDRLASTFDIRSRAPTTMSPLREMENGTWTFRAILLHPSPPTKVAITGLDVELSPSPRLAIDPCSDFLLISSICVRCRSPNVPLSMKVVDQHAEEVEVRPADNV
jgi:hypothetical protein